MFCTVDTASAFHVCLSTAQERALEAALVEDSGALLDAFAAIDVRTAKASPDDTAMIMGAIQRLPEGAAGLNGLAMAQMRRWAVQKVEQMVAARRELSGSLAQDEADLRALGSLASFLRRLGEFAAARQLHEEVIEGETAQLGASHPSTLATKRNLADLQKQMGEVAAARQLYEEVIEGQTAQLGASHTSTLGTKRNLADLQAKMGEVAAARQLYEEVIEGLTAQLGASHPDTLVTKCNLAVLFETTEGGSALSLAQAKALYEEVAAGRTAHFGPTHERTLEAQQDLRRVARKETRADHELPAGTRISVAPHGAGSYAGFHRKRVGANRHTIDFDEGGRQAVQLRGLRWSLVGGVLGRSPAEEEEHMLQTAIAQSLQDEHAAGTA